MRRRCIPLLLVALVLCAAGDGGPSRSFERGLYHRDAEFGFEMWLLAGFSPATAGQDSEKTRFVNSTGVVRQVSIREAPGSTLSQYVDAVKDAAAAECKQCTFKVYRDESAGRYPAALVLIRNLGSSKHYVGTEIISAGLDLGRGTIVDLTAFLDSGQSAPALAELRWMLSTVRRSGEDGFDPYLASRQVDLQTGLSYRPPRGFQSARPAEGPHEIVYASAGLSGDTRMTITPAKTRDLDGVIREAAEGMTRVGTAWTSPHHADVKLRCALFTTTERARGRAVLAAAVAPEQSFSIRVDGPFDRREFLTRTAELVGMSLDFVDLAGARAQVAAAAAELQSAVERGRPGEAAAQAQILAKYAFLKEARTALSASLPRIRDTSAQLAVIRALGATRTSEVVPDLIKCAKNMKRKKRPAVVQAVLHALGSAHGKKAVYLLLDFARRGTPEQAAAAVRSLGQYELEKKRITRELVKLMARTEKYARKKDFDARTRWSLLRPAFEESLLNLTGHRFTSGSEARSWLRKR